jgi:hypothetical protein
MSTFRIILATVILLFAAYIVVVNWGCVIVSLRNKRRGIDRHHSTVPLLSFVITIVAMTAYPWPWGFVIPLLDFANWSLLWAPFGLIREMLKKNIAEPVASPNGGQTMPPGDSGTTGGPPSVR